MPNLEDRLAATTKVQKRYARLFKRSKKRVVRYGILAANVVVLVTVVGFVIKAPSTGPSVNNSIAGTTSSAPQSALDQVSSADIAVHVARLTNLAEANSVSNNADSVNAQSAVAPADNTVVAKPQIVATTLKSYKDIQTYVVVPGDTVATVASKFSITSDTVRWSNGITGDALTPGAKLLISPVPGLVYVAKAGDTIDSLVTKFKANKEQLILDNDAESGTLRVGQKILVRDGSIAAVVASRSAVYTGGFAWGSSAIYSANGYDYGWCTWYAANRRNEIGRPVPSNLGNAYSWYRIAQRAGLPTGLTPQVGAVAVNEGGNHVSIVEQVNGDGSFWISEMNSHGQVSMTDATPAGGWGRRDFKLIPSAGSLKFVY